MKRRLRYAALVAVALLLCFATISGAALETRTSSAVADLLNYGIAGMGSNETIPASELFEALTGEAPTASEQAYLDGLSGISFVYNSAIPDSIVSTRYNGEAGTLEVSLEAYRFTAENGTEVCWVPDWAKIEGQTLNFTQTDGVFSCCFENLFHSDDFDMEIGFDWSVEISAEAINGLLGAPYSAAEQALEVLRNHEAEYAVWLAAQEQYLAYQAYLQSLQDYADYLEACDAYDAAMVVYGAYMEKYNAYAEELAAYEAWQHYYAYQDFLTNGLVQYNAYMEYKQQVEKVRSKLAVLDTLFLTDSNGWQLYALLMGNTVTQVVARKNELITAGCNAEDINAAGDSTVVLRRLMEGYAALYNATYPSEHARLTALYNYYTANYTEIRNQFAKLYGALISLYGNSLVVGQLSKEGKLAHFRQFVGQLYITATCLDDEVTQSADWRISKKKLTDVVEELQRVTDTNSADPAGTSMPTVEVSAVEKVEPIEKPTVPFVKDPPTAPTPVVPEPVKPTVVEKPDTSKAPTEVGDPGEAPAAPDMDSRLRALAEDLRNGALPKRASVSEGETFTLQKTISCPVSIRNLMTVTFYDYDGVTVLDRQTLEYGSAVVYGGEKPARESDANYHYTFLAWVLPDGSAAEMMATGNLSLYARYRTTERFYNVTWILNGETRVKQLPYGALPESPFDTEKKPDHAYSYVFSGWDKEIVPVSGDITYTGTLTSVPQMYTVSWQIGEQTVTEQFAYGSLPVYTGSTDLPADSYLYEFAGWNKVILPVSGDATYVAQYRKTPLAVTNDNSVMEVVHTEDTVIVKSTQKSVDIRTAAVYAQAHGKALEVQFGVFAWSLQHSALEKLTDSYCRRVGILEAAESGVGTVYTVGYLNNAGYVLDLQLPATMRAIPNSAGYQTVGYVADGDSWKSVGAEAVAVTGSATFRVCDARAITVDYTENCNVSQLPSFAEVGSVVNLRLGCVFGYEVSAAKVTLSDGTAVAVKDLCFVMPAGDVTVELTVTEIIYHVTFVADGKVIAEADYKLGEEIVIPAVPTKSSDEQYDYTFTGWSQNVTVAMGDDHNPVYEAIFSKTVRSDHDPYKSGHNNNAFLTVVLPILAGALLLGGGVIFFLRWRKKKLAAVDVKNDIAEENTEPESTEEIAASGSEPPESDESQDEA